MGDVPSTSTGPSNLNALSSSVTRRDTSKEPEEYSAGSLTSAIMKDQENSSRSGTVPFYAGMAPSYSHGMSMVRGVLLKFHTSYRRTAWNWTHFGHPHTRTILEI